MKTQRIIISLLLCIGCYSVKAQLTKGPRQELVHITEDQSKTSWLHFKRELAITPEQLFTVHKDAFALRPADEMRKDRELPMRTGYIQERYQQYYNGLPVYGAGINVYSKDGIAIKANGRVIHDLQAPATPVITEEKALATALDNFKSRDYAWNYPELEIKYKKKKKDPSVTLYPAGKLIYMFAKERSGYNAEAYTLCWKFDIAFKKSGEYSVYIDAVKGTVHHVISLTHNCSPAVAQTPFNGLKVIYTTAAGNCVPVNRAELIDDCWVYLEVLDHNMGNGTTPICAPTSPNNWSNLNGVQSDGVQVSWGMREVANFHNVQYNWNSYDNDMGSLDCYVHVQYEDDDGNPHGQNASYSSFWEDFDFGYGISGTDPQDSYTSLDVCGHEFTHGVDDFSADLVYEDESGALDESFADIIGKTIDRNASSNDWLIGGAISTGAIRNMADPNAFNDPHTYQGTHWYTGSDDSRWVHTNSGVQNFMYVLLTEGGSGTNDNGTQYIVSGIGLYDAHHIAFTAHSYLFWTSTYLNSRDAWIEAAIDLYGSCSNQAIQTANAWHAVGVGSQSPYYSNMVTGTQTAIVSTLTREAIDHVFTVGATTINSLSNSSNQVRFYSSNQITLNPGFTAASGTQFLARISACSATLHTAIRTAPESTSMVNNPGMESVKADNIQDKALEIKAWPNPFNDKITIEFKGTEGMVDVYITDIAGKLIKNEKINTTDGDNYIMELADLTAGVYMLKVLTDEGKEYLQRIVKQD